jgi:tRNA A37 threonylcarbamoyladenosine synthetase subunit TsaC/SUA5/YrdC
MKDYNLIYKIKKRDLSKPLAILIPDFEWLKNNTSLTSEQIKFLKNYKRPFTVLTDCDNLKIWINYVDEDNNEFLNKDVYNRFAFRVANNDTQKRLLKEN